MFQIWEKFQNSFMMFHASSCYSKVLDVECGSPDLRVADSVALLCGTATGVELSESSLSSPQSVQRGQHLWEAKKGTQQ